MSLRAQQLNSRRFQYPISSGNFSLNGTYLDGTPVRSTKNTPGYISSTVTHPTPVYNPSCGGANKCPTNIVKTLRTVHAQLGYEGYLKEKTLKCDVSGAKTIPCNSECVGSTKFYYIGGQKFYPQTNVNNIITATNSDYIERKHKANVCSTLTNVVVPPKSGGPCS